MLLFNHDDALKVKLIQNLLKHLLFHRCSVAIRADKN